MLYTYMSTSPAAAMRWFTLITAIYFPVRYYSKSELTLFIYLLLIFIGCYSINLTLSESLCNTYQYSTAFTYTLFPWALIFGIMILILRAFPGWLEPFSNTFGYGLAKATGSDKILKAIFITPGTSGNNELTTAINYIYTDPSIILNKISPENFENFWGTMLKSNSLKPDALTYKEALNNTVRFKYAVAEYIWYMLTGLLTCSVSYNYVTDAQCTINEKDLQSFN